MQPPTALIQHYSIYEQPYLFPFIKPDTPLLVYAHLPYLVRSHLLLGREYHVQLDVYQFYVRHHAGSDHRHGLLLVPLVKGIPARHQCNHHDRSAQYPGQTVARFCAHLYPCDSRKFFNPLYNLVLCSLVLAISNLSLYWSIIFFMFFNFKNPLPSSTVLISELLFHPTFL